MHQSLQLKAIRFKNKNHCSQTSRNISPTILKPPPDPCESDRKSLTCRVWSGVSSERRRCERAQWRLHLHSQQQRGSSLLAHNVNLARIKASVGTSVDNRKSLFIEKHPVVGLGVDDPSCCGPAERHILVVVEPHTSSPPIAEQSHIPLT